MDGCLFCKVPVCNSRVSHNFTFLEFSEAHLGFHSFEVTNESCKILDLYIDGNLVVYCIENWPKMIKYENFNLRRTFKILLQMSYFIYHWVCFFKSFNMNTNKLWFVLIIDFLKILIIRCIFGKPTFLTYSMNFIQIT